MKYIFFVTCIAAIVSASAHLAEAEVIGGVNWADDVTDYSSKIQNYGGTLMDSTTEFWVTGAPDADADGNGYVWDAGDLDNLAGWRTTDANQFLIVHFGIGLADVPGDDLSICSFGGPNANANVFASANGSDYVQIGALVGGTPGHLSNESFDFDGLSNVHYVKVERVATGPQTGIFFDAFGGVPVPEPASATFLAVGIGLLGLYRRSQFLRSRISG